jgi:hypothetical protein
LWSVITFHEHHTIKSGSKLSNHAHFLAS